MSCPPGQPAAPPTGAVEAHAQPPARSPVVPAIAAIAAAAGRLSHLFGHGGQVLPGRIALALRPNLLADLAVGRRTALVSGTNGKTTTTALLAAALGRIGAVATNASGANMLDGVTTTLLANRAPLVAAEIDEQYLPAATARLDPELLVLLNLSRDQLDRVGETRTTALRWRDMVRGSSATVVANCDDPLVAWAARDRQQVVWVAAGRGWDTDRRICPDCAHSLQSDHATGAWRCPSCGAARPQPAWAVVAHPSAGDAAHGLQGPDGHVRPLRPTLPGSVNRGNAAIAVAAATQFGVAPQAALDAVCDVTEVAGRYAVTQTSRHTLWLLLAKNPAGWAAAMDMLPGDATPVVIAVNGAEADGRDTSWLFDVPFRRLGERAVIAAGARAADVGVRLAYAGVPHTTSHGDPLKALHRLPPGPVTVIADYTSFRDLYRELGVAVSTHAA